MEVGPPSMTAHCLDADVFNYICVSGKCEKKEKCELLCDLSGYNDALQKVVLGDCPATSQACNLYEKCGCEK